MNILMLQLHLFLLKIYKDIWLIWLDMFFTPKSLLKNKSPYCKGYPAHISDNIHLVEKVYVVFISGDSLSY